ncbi:MAG TPA: zf-HC2 domain-containing protein [Acidobacteriota bacterium]|nr:zf-HC2 domain-containing protein [Acidobacteriota bacterium]
MNHEYFEDRISAYLDHGLPPMEQAAVEEHLKACQKCQQLLARLKELDGLVDRHSQLGGNGYWEQSARKIEERIGIAATEVTDVQPAGRGRGPGWKWATAVASVAILAAIGLRQSDIVRDETMVPAVRAPQQPAAGEESVPEVKEAEVEEPSGAIQEEFIPTPAKPTELPDAADRREKPAASSGTRGRKEEPAPVSVQPPAETVYVQGGKKGEEDHLAGESLESRDYKSDVKKESEEEFFQPQAVVPELADLEPRGAGDLGVWRQRRDSLMALFRAPSQPDKSIVERAGLKSALVERTTMDRDSQARIEAGLLEACYRVAILSPDSSETARAAAILDSIAVDTTSPSRDLARRYLERLRKQ